jgi:ribosome-binding factor A
VANTRMGIEYAILEVESSTAMEAIRLQRVSEQIREELTELIEYEMSDPRVEGITVTDVHIAPDGRKARVMVALSSPEGREEAMEALEHARAYLRTQVAHRLSLHRTPDLQFELDAVVDPAHLNKIMKRIRKGRPKD